MKLKVKYLLCQKVAIALTAIILFETLFPTAALALTGGPSQPEVQSFEPIGTSEMVDVFTGDFNYNIPLLDVGGYPVNLSYHAGTTMDEEASWVGLGWNINPGAITRGTRGLPDDFNGDKIIYEQNIKDNHTFGVIPMADIEIIGKKINYGLSFGFGVSYNNYKGLGFERMFTPSVSIAGKNDNNAYSIGLGISQSAESGVSIEPSFSLSWRGEKHYDGSLGFNTRDGLQKLTITGAFNPTQSLFNLARKGVLKIKMRLSGTTPQGVANFFKYKGRFDAIGSTMLSSGRADYSFATANYTPAISMPTNTFGLSFTGKTGSEFTSVAVGMQVTGYYTGQFLKDRYLETPAYGYLFPYAPREAVMDFSRENDGLYTKYTPNLPVTNFTFDTYTVLGQGIGGIYRPYRSDVGIVKDYPRKSMSANVALPSLDIGTGNMVKAGIDFNFIYSNSTSGKWEKDNYLVNEMAFRESTGDVFYEPYYFKQAGELTAETDPDFFNAIGSYDALRVDMVPNALTATSQFLSANGLPFDLHKPGTSENQMGRTKRQSRNQTISVLNAKEASSVGLLKDIESYPLFQYVDGEYVPQSLVNGKYAPQASYNRTGRPEHHISEITALRPDGARYIYGIPAYNNTQQEATFAITNGSPDCATGLVDYNAGTDDSKDNKNGLDHYFNKVTTPAYAHSYLLTAVLSDDYVDLTGNGPSDDDLGAYTKINYTKILDDYKWRTPFSRANYQEGLKSLKNDNKKGGDDKASYVYGEKEIWMMHSIETRTHVAEFILDEEVRQDGQGVMGSQGGMYSDTEVRNEKALRRLKEIRLYSKEDKIKEALTAIPATPVKIVHFKYDYSLCPGIANSSAGGGKLTLKEVWFTYGKSNKGRLNSYKFNYNYTKGENTFNPSYNLRGYDRWGNYKPNDGGCGVNDALPTSEFPYVEQSLLASNSPYYDTHWEDRTTTDLYATAWNLTSIELPSGGIINVEYESDDYAYVQDKKAMQMFKIAGSDVNAPTSSTNVNAYGDLMASKGNGNTIYPYLYFELHRPLSMSESDANSYVADNYVKDIGYLKYNFLVKVSGNDQDDKYEYVPGYGEVLESGIVPKLTNGKYTHGFVKLKSASISDKDENSCSNCVNPISKQSWLFARLHLPQVAFRQQEIGEDKFLSVLEKMLGSKQSAKEFFKSPNAIMRDENFGKIFVQNKSWIRLNNPTGFKEGGGVRVRKITISDEWKNMFNGTQANYKNEVYGQTYEYTTTNEKDEIISSGVASYEPIVGGDENPFKQPIFYKNKKILAPDDKYYQETPMGESHFPAPSVGYSKITVRNIARTGVTRHATGAVVSEFYTARDFPTIVRQTSAKPWQFKTSPAMKLLGFNYQDYMNVSQGFAIELNDMHGKPKGNAVYAEGSDKKISGITYYYKKSTNNALDNNVDVIYPDGTIAKSNLGVDFDMIMDMRESQSTTTGTAGQFNVDGFIAGIFPLVLAMIYPQLTSEKTRFRSAVSTKVINRYGLIDRVEAFENGATAITKNLLYDAITGEVLLTEVNNEFNDRNYAFSYPAHWAYDRMGAAYRNMGISFYSSSLSGISNASSYFVLGDELLLEPSGGATIKGWVTKVNSTGIEAKDLEGNAISGSTNWSRIKVIRSGRRNQQSTAIGAIASRVNPMVNGKLNFREVLDAGAVEYGDAWKTYCDCAGNNNPFNSGALGVFRPVKNYTYLTDRIQTRLNDNVNLRTDGVFKNFSPFWNAPNPIPGPWIKNDNNWTWSSQVTLLSPYGYELENMDALNRYSSAQYGYGNTLPKAVSKNAKYREIGFDDFEDYGYDNCAGDHFNFKENNESNVVPSTSHTGRKSIKVTPQQGTVTMTKDIGICE